LMIAGLVFCAGSLMQTVSFGHVAVMYVGRAIGGLVSIASPPNRILSLTICLGRRRCQWTRTSLYCRAFSTSDKRPTCRHLRDQRPDRYLHRLLDLLWGTEKYEAYLFTMDLAFRRPAHSRRASDHRNVLCARVTPMAGPTQVSRYRSTHPLQASRSSRGSCLPSRRAYSHHGYCQ